MKRLGRMATIVAIGALSVGTLAGCGASLDREVTVQGMVMEVPGNWLENIGSANNSSRGTVNFVEENDDRDEDETGNAIEVSYIRISGEAAKEGSAEEALETGGGPASSGVVAVQNGSSAATEASDAEAESEAFQATSSDDVESALEETAIDDEPLGKMADSAPAPKTAVEAMAVKQAKLEKEQGVMAWSIDDEKTRVVDGAQVTSYEYSFVKEIAGERRKYEYKTVYVVTPAVMYEISIVGDAVSADALIDTIEL